jgi:hypothetical protein
VAGIAIGLIRLLPDAPAPFRPRMEQPALEAPAPAAQAVRRDIAKAPETAAEVSAPREAPAKEYAPRLAQEEGRARDESGVHPGVADRVAPAPPARKRREQAPSGSPPEDMKRFSVAERGAELTPDPRALLLAPRVDVAWVEEILALIRARPAGIAAAWRGLDEGARVRVLEAWGRAATRPGVREAIARALRGAPTPGEKALLEALRNATPEPASEAAG